MSTSIWLIEDRFASLIQSARDVIFTSHSAPLTDGPVLALFFCAQPPPAGTET